MRAEIPDKLYFKISEVAGLADVAPHVLRYWESEFKQIRPKRAHSNQRLYRRKDVEVILEIKSLLHEQGYTISGARKFLASQDNASLGQEKNDNTDCLETIKQELLAVKKLLKGKKE